MGPCPCNISIPHDWAGRQVVQGYQSLSVLRFIPVGQDVSNVLIHLLSLIFLSMMSFLQHLLMIMTERSVSEWPSLLK